LGSQAIPPPVFYASTRRFQGRRNLTSSLFFDDEPQKALVFDRKSVSDGTAWTSYFYIGEGSAPVQGALVWTDEPANVNCQDSGPCLVNNLDLRVQDPSGFWYGGNDYCSGGFPLQSCPYDSETLLEPEALNNVEKVGRNVPSTGWWTVRVVGRNVVSASQFFALVVSGDLQGGFKGWVKDAWNGNAVSGASLSFAGRIISYSSSTDSNGYFSRGFRPDTYTITASRCDYEPASVTGTVEPGLWPSRTVRLNKKGTGTAYGYVRDSNGNAPSNARVRESCTGTYDYTDSNGYYSLSLSGGVDITLTASKSGYYSQSKTVNVPVGGSKQVDFSLMKQDDGGGGCGLICPTSVTSPSRFSDAPLSSPDSGTRVSVGASSPLDLPMDTALHSRQGIDLHASAPILALPSAVIRTVPPSRGGLI
jgi:hypothetical protein